MKANRAFLMSLPILIWLLPTSGCARRAMMEERKVFSANGVCAVEIRPHVKYYNFPGHCLATLTRKGERVWSRDLINDWDPYRVLVSDSGYVVTMGERDHFEGLPLVIYGSSGDTVCVHSLVSLGLMHEFMIRSVVGYTGRGWNWLENSICLFMEDEGMFCIRLNSGRIVLVQLENGGIASDKDAAALSYGGWQEMSPRRLEALEEKAREEIRTKEIPRMFSSQDPDERETAALVCGQERLEDKVEALRGLLGDGTFYLRRTEAGTVRVYYVRKAATEALRVLKREVGEVVLEERVEAPEEEPDEEDDWGDDDED